VNSPGASTVGQPVTFSATVSPQLATGQPTGDVTFTVDGVATGAAVAVTNGVATYLTSTLPAGPHTVQAAYGGDSVFTASSASVAHLVSKTATTTGLVSSRNPSSFGDNVTFTATVSQASATGTVQFTVDGTDVGAPVDVVNGQASFSTSGLAVAFHAVTATYNGDAVFGGSVSPTLTQSVGPVLRATSTVVTSNRTPSAPFGQAVTFTARVRALAGPGTPTGAVHLAIDGQAVAMTLNGQGQATYLATGLSAGTHTVVASYGGSGIFAGSSGTLTQVVSQATSATVVTSSRNPSVAGQSVTLTARVTPAGATGTVQFLIGGVAVNGPVPLDATGRATFVTSTFTVGSRQVSATYSGNVNYRGSTSATITQVVNRAASRTTVTSSQSPATRGSTVVLTAAVTAVAPGTGTDAGTVQFRVDGVNVGAARTLDANGRATYATSTLSVGRHTVVAVYGGNVRFTASTSRTFRQRIR
jgi:Bacterial Ig-like domain (group 3)